MAISIDTLRVPLFWETNKLALKLLPRIYAETSYCRVILEEELREVSCEDHAGRFLSAVCLFRLDRECLREVL